MDNISDRSSHLLGFLRGAFKCLIVVGGVVLLKILISPPTMETLDKVRGFTPLTIGHLLSDAMSDCVPNPDPSDLLHYRPKCKAEPIVGDWPHVGHWVTGVSGVTHGWGAPVVAALDVGWHLIFAGDALTAAVGVAQILLGLGISAAIAQRVDGLNDYWLALFIIIGALVFGAFATWIIMNLVALVYDALSTFVPDWRVRLGLAVLAVLTAACKSSVLALKSLLIDQSADTLADKAAGLIQRYLL